MKTENIVKTSMTLSAIIFSSIWGLAGLIFFVLIGYVFISFTPGFQFTFGDILGTFFIICGLFIGIMVFGTIYLTYKRNYSK